MSPRTPAPPPSEPEPRTGITAQEFAPTASQWIPMAGLLTHKPDLADAELPEDEWRKVLDAYLTSTEDER